MYELHVQHPCGIFTAEYDPEVKTVYSTNIHSTDLLWCQRYPDHVQPEGASSLLQRTVSVVVVPTSPDIHPCDALGLEMAEKTQYFSNAAENYRALPADAPANMVRNDHWEQDSFLHADGCKIVLTRACVGPSTYVAIDRNTLERKAIAAAAERERGRSDYRSYFAHRPDMARFAWHRATTGCVIAMPGSEIAEHKRATYHARPMFNDPRLFSRGFMNGPVAVQVTRVRKIAFSALRDRALAQVHLPPEFHH